VEARGIPDHAAKADYQFRNERLEEIGDLARKNVVVKAQE
jgi:hypothetical protein